MLSFLRRNKWLLAFLIWTLGQMIVYSAFVTDPDDRHGLLLYNSLFTLVFPALFLFLSGRIRQIGLVVFFLLSLPSSLIETGWFLMDRSLLIRNQFWVIFATNPAEASGFLSMVQGWHWLLLVCYVGISITLLVFAVREAGTQTHFVGSAFGVIALLCISLLPPMRANVPWVDFYVSYHAYQGELSKVQTFLQNRQDLTGVVRNDFPDSTATVVVIIGESLSRCHCSLYGYCRPTNPRLGARKDLVVYRNVVAPDFMTQTVMQQILTFATAANPEARWNAPTLPELLNAAGWQTYWFDPYEGTNNTSKTIPTGFSSIAKLCSSYHLCNETERYDGAYLAHLDTILHDSTVPRKAVFLHLIGNHFPYERRYPEAFRFFDKDDVCSPFIDRLTPDRIAVVNAYDDATRYNDWLVDSVLNVLSNVSESAALLYFPDHGEEVYDYDFYAGRSFNHITQGLYEIPCVFWQNEAFHKGHPLHLDTERPYCTENMIHTFLDLFAVSYERQDSTRSLFYE